MMAKDIVVGESYRHKENPKYCYAKVIKVLQPRELENTTNKIIAKCEYSVNKDDSFGLIKYFKISDLVRDE